MQRPTSKQTSVLVLSLALCLMLLIIPAQAQQTATPSPSPVPTITFTGTIGSVAANQIVVNGLLVDIQGLDIAPERLQIGTRVTVSGVLQNGLIVAINLSFDDDDDTSNNILTATFTPTPSATPTPGATPTYVPPIIIIEGPVVSITQTTLIIYDFNIQINQNVNVTNIRVGDRVRVHGDLNIVNNTINIVAVNIVIINIDQRDSGRQPPRPPAGSGRGSRSSRSS